MLKCCQRTLFVTEVAGKSSLSLWEHKCLVLTTKCALENHKKIVPWWINRLQERTEEIQLESRFVPFTYRYAVESSIGKLIRKLDLDHTVYFVIHAFISSFWN